MKTIILAALLLAATTAQAQIYKCIEDGKVVYTHLWCPTFEASLNLKVYQPSKEDQKLAEMRAAELLRSAGSSMRAGTSARSGAIVRPPARCNAR